MGVTHGNLSGDGVDNEIEAGNGGGDNDIEAGNGGAKRGNSRLWSGQGKNRRILGWEREVISSHIWCR